MIDPLSPETERKPEQSLSREEILQALQAAVEGWDFSNPLAEGFNAEFATTITHWVLETFGQSNNNGEYFLFSDRDGFKGEELPTSMQHLVMSAWKDEPFLTGENRVSLQTRQLFVEDEPTIPEWETISTLTTFQGMLDYIKARPDIVAGIKPRRVSVAPQVSLIFEPAYYHDWGLEFLVNDTDILVAPFGKVGKTWKPLDYVVESRGKTAEVAQAVCQLALLAARYSDTGSRRQFPAQALQSLHRRLTGEEETPISSAGFEPRPGNSIVDLLIRESGFRTSTPDESD